SMFGSLKAVYATDAVHLAALYAVIRRAGLSSRVNGIFRSVGVEYLFYSIEHEAADPARYLCEGWIYVFRRGDFSVDPDDPHHWASERAVTPLRRVRVSSADLPYRREIWHHDRRRLLERIE